MGSIIDISEVLLESGLSDSATDTERAIVSTAIMRAEGAVKRHLRYDPVLRSRVEFYPQRYFSQASAEGVWDVEGAQAVYERTATLASGELQLRHLPVRANPTIDLRVDYDGRSGARAGSFAADTRKTEGEDWNANYDGQDSDGHGICLDGILRSPYGWPVEPGTVKVVYTAGYTAEELHGQDAIVDASPIADAVIEEATRRVQKVLTFARSSGVGTGGPFTSEKLGDYAYTKDSALITSLYGGQWDLMPATQQKLEEFVNWGWGMGS